MKLVVISSPNVIADEAQIINSLFAAGLQHFHLRKPDTTYSCMTNLLAEIKNEYYPRIALHQFHEAATDFGIQRLHLTEDYRRKVDHHTLHNYLKQGYKLSTSIHHLPDAQNLPGFEYTFFSPVFNSFSKPGYLSTVSPDFKLPIKKEIRVIALGGVTANHLDSVKAMNFDGAAVLGAIWCQPEKALQSFNHLMNSLPDKNEHR